MKMMRIFALACGLVVTVMTADAQPTIDNTNWPYGADQLGNHWNYYNTSSSIAVDIGAINPYQQSGVWDFTAGPTTTTASSEIRATNLAPQPPPANTTFVEYQTQGGQTQWLYEDELGTGTWARGFAQGGTIYAYSAPQWNIYHYPMTFGTIWNSSWVWGESELGVPVQEARNNEIVGWGTVVTPFGGPLSCLVIRTLQTSYAEFMGVPVIDEAYRLYEWIVPGIGSVVTIQSVSHEANWYFNTASGYYRLYDSNLGGDLVPPQITAVTQLTNTPNPGPYTVNAQITDGSGIASALLYYSVAGGAFVSRIPESVNGSSYEFLIPQLIGSPVQQVRYYIWAQDNSPDQNTATSPAGAPANFYSFDWIQDNLPPAFANVTVWPSPTNFNGPYPVNATITDDNGILFASIHYKFGNGAWEEAAADGNNGNVYTFTIPGISATTIIRYYLEAVDNSGFFNTGFHPPSGQAGPIVFQAVYSAPVPPRAINDLVISYSAGDIILRWTPVTTDINGNPVTVSYYNVYRGTAGDGSDGALIGQSAAATYTDVGATSASPKYFYDVRAVRP